MLGDGKTMVGDLPEPVPYDNYVLVKVMATTICGSERHTYDHGLARAGASGWANVGHEAAGIVSAVDSASTVKVGDRVILFASPRHCGECEHCLSGRWVLCRGNDQPEAGSGMHSQFVIIREDFCLPLPDDLDFEAGAMFTDTLGTPLRAITRLRVGEDDTVLVSGQGPVGLAATMLCRFLGATVIATDTNDYRLGCATECGANTVVNPQTADLRTALREFADPDGVSVAIDCSGSQAGRLASLDAVRRGNGRVAFVGLGEGLEMTSEEASRIFLKEVELIGSWYSDPEDMVKLAALVRQGLQPSKMVTHRFPIENAPEAFDTCFGGAGAKVVILPWE